MDFLGRILVNDAVIDRWTAVVDAVGAKVVPESGFEVGSYALWARWNALVSDHVAAGEDVFVAEEVGAVVDRIPPVARVRVAAGIAETRPVVAFTTPAGLSAVAHVGLLKLVG